MSTDATEQTTGPTTFVPNISVGTGNVKVKIPLVLLYMKDNHILILHSSFVCNLHVYISTWDPTLIDLII